MYLLKLSTSNNNQQAKIRESSTVSILEIDYRKLNRKKKEKGRLQSKHLKEWEGEKR